MRNKKKGEEVNPGPTDKKKEKKGKKEKDNRVALKNANQT